MGYLMHAVQLSHYTINIAILVSSVTGTCNSLFMLYAFKWQKKVTLRNPSLASTV